MFEEILVIQNPHWTNEPYDSGVKRACFAQLLEYLDTGQIVAVTGVRRAGKSTIVKQLIDYLIHFRKIPPENILFFNLEHPYLSPYREDITILQRIYEDYLKIAQPKGNVFIFLDEVQFFREWPIFVKSHHETKKAHFVITGSNAAMLSSDMVTMLSGRSLPLEVFPFSLREIACNRGIDIDNPSQVALKTPEIKHLIDELLEYGGFPTVALRTLNQTAFDILGAHARTVLLQDVVPRLGARKPEDLEKFYVYIVSNISKLFTYLGLSKLFGLSDKSIKEYLEAFSDAHLLYEVDIFSYSLKKQMRSQKKVYSIDTGQANAMGFRFSANRGRLLENLIFIELKRLQLEVYYFKSATGHELDFVVKRGVALSLIQITWDLNDLETRERELRGLREAMAELHCETGTIIVIEPDFSKEPLEQGITVIPAYKYLMMNPIEQKQFLFKE